MFKKSALLATVLLLSACSSYTDKTDYMDNVVVKKTQHQDYVEVAGKEIIPVDLLELNLGLKVSLLSVTAKLPSSDSQTQDTLQSDVAFAIEYTREKQPQDASSSEKQSIEQYNVALVDGTKIDLQANNVSQRCDDKICTVSQSFTFPVSSNLLSSSKEDGLKFKLFETTNNDKLVLETMIPGRYLTALLAK